MPPDLSGINEMVMLLVRRKIFEERVRALEILLHFHCPYRSGSVSTFRRYMYYQSYDDSDTESMDTCKSTLGSDSS